jgi:distribution and morphology protein 31
MSTGKKEHPAADKPIQGEDGRPDVRGLFERVSHIHRPTKDEMLAAATGAWQRFRIRTKWSLIRQMRPYSMEDIGAFFSWLLLGHIVWIVVGTTTFLSVAIFLVNTVVAQGREAYMQQQH